MHFLRFQQQDEYPKVCNTISDEWLHLKIQSVVFHFVADYLLFQKHFY